MRRRNDQKPHKFCSVVFLSAVLALSGCGKGADALPGLLSGAGESGGAVGVITSMDVSNLFTSRDKEIGYDEAQCVVISLNGDGASCGDSAVSIDGGRIVIQKKGSYILRGTLTNGSIEVDAGKDDKVQLIFDGADISCEGTAPVYCKKADKVFFTLAAGSDNKISNAGEFSAIDENKIDGAVFAKCDLTLNGTGSLSVVSEKGHGIVSKDDLAITGGTYRITSGDHGISGKDSIRIADGEMEITCAQDGLHSGNDEDADKGYVYIEGGSLAISAGDDGIHGESRVMICGGEIRVLKSYEGIEAKVVEIAGGEIELNASDDGINAADGNSSDGFGKGGPAIPDFGEGGFTVPDFGEGGFEAPDFGKDGFAPPGSGEDGFNPPGDFGKDGFVPPGSGEDGFNPPDGFGKFDGMPPQSSSAESTDASEMVLRISGGRVTVNAGGDGLDSNGDFYMTGGEVYVSGPENSANGAIDYENNAQITGGTLVAVGASGMAMNFRSAGQGSALVVTSQTHNAGETVELRDSQGKVLLCYTPGSKFNSVVVSCPEMKENGTYVLCVGSETQEFSLVQFLYGESFGFGGGPGKKGRF